MKNFPVGTKVEDKWFYDFGIGTVIKSLKTRIKIRFTRRDNIMTYDKEHTQFLEKLKHR